MPGYGNQSKRGKLSSAGLVIQILDLPASYKWFRRVCGPAATQANLAVDISRISSVIRLIVSEIRVADHFTQTMWLKISCINN